MNCGTVMNRICGGTSKTEHFSTLAKKHTKPVVQLSQSNEVLNTFKSISLAAKAVGGIPSNISSCARGKLKNCYGYKWRYADEASCYKTKVGET